MSGAKGMAEIPVDLTDVPTVDAGLANAKALDRVFTNLAKGSMTAPGAGDPKEKLLLTWHLPLMAFVNRAVSLHRGIVAMVEQENPHATFTLMRAYLELVVLVHYVNRHPDYLTVLAYPPDQLSKGRGRKSYESLLTAAAKQMPGVRRVYRTLTEMAHFGSTAMWHPFEIKEEDEERTALRFGTAPHWRQPDDARVAVAMLLENDRAAIELLAEFVRVHVWPEVARATEEGRSLMLLVSWDAGSVAWWSPEVWTVFPWSHELVEQVRQVLNGADTRGHATGALMRLPGAAVAGP